MTDQLKILTVDQNPDLLAKLRHALSFEDVQVVHETGFGPVALTWARNLQPDVVLVTVEEPLARSLATVEMLASGDTPWTVVALAERYEADLFRKAVLSGARDVALHTAPGAELRDTLLNARRADKARRVAPSQEHLGPTGTVISVFGIKGGIGKTTVAVNLAIALAQETARSVALVDFDLPFGDLAVMLDLKPERDLSTALEPGVVDDPERLQAQLTQGPGGVYVLPAPLNPNANFTIDGAQVGKVLTRLASLYDFVVVDTPPGVSEVLAATLDIATLGLMVTTPEVPCLRRTQGCLQMLYGWGCSPDKLKLVLNRAASKTGIKSAEAEALLGYPIAWRVANDRTALQGAATGQPVVLSQPRSALARDVRLIARQVGGVQAKQRSLLTRLLPLRYAAAL
ncbi:MAG TPA: AAA family ATPase [Nocardioides sp.]|nr:AAA family ATPase [Nocardioides sp.]